MERLFPFKDIGRISSLQQMVHQLKLTMPSCKADPVHHLARARDRQHVAVRLNHTFGLYRPHAFVQARKIDEALISTAVPNPTERAALRWKFEHLCTEHERVNILPSFFVVSCSLFF